MDYFALSQNTVIITGIVLFFGIFGYALFRWIRELRARPAVVQIKPEPITRMGRRSVLRGRPSWQIFLLALGTVLVSRLLLFFIGYLIVRMTIPEISFLNSIRYQLYRWDVGQYVLIADEWYANFGDQRLAIVFFPLYPSLMRVLNLIVRDSFISGMIISFLSLAGSMTILYSMVREELDEDSAVFSALFMLLAPMAFFMTNTYSESLFILLTLGAIYAARKRWFFIACLLGGLSTLSRLLGFIVGVPILIEMISAFREAYQRRDEKPFSFSDCMPVMYLAFIPLALMTYLALNYQITGNAFEFLTIQAEHWYNTTGNLFNTISYLFRNSIVTSYPMKFDLWITQFAFLVMFFALLVAACRKARAADIMYSLVYLLFAFMSEWLLSGARYLLAVYAIYPAMAHVFRGRKTRLTVMAVSSLVMMFYYIMFICGRDIL